MNGPTVNLNGTDGTVLFKERYAVVSALIEARKAIAAQTIHGRDYQGNEAQLYEDMRETAEDLRTLRAMAAKYEAQADRLAESAYTGKNWEGNNRA